MLSIDCVWHAHPANITGIEEIGITQTLTSSQLLFLLIALCMMTSKQRALCQDQTRQGISEAKEEVFWCTY